MYGVRPYQRVEDLPASLSIFPLTGALLLPRGHLPLNIFEPRYLAMVDAALSGDRLIGMIQPTEPEGEHDRPALSAVGCAGRITGYRETEDGRYLITLTGICRFRLDHELETTTPFRQIQPDFAPFRADLVPAEDEDGAEFPRERLLGALKAYLHESRPAGRLGFDDRRAGRSAGQRAGDAVPVRAGREAGAAGGAGLAGAGRDLDRAAGNGRLRRARRRHDELKAPRWNPIPSFLKFWSAR